MCFMSDYQYYFNEWTNEINEKFKDLEKLKKNIYIYIYKE